MCLCFLFIDLFFSSIHLFFSFCLIYVGFYVCIFIYMFILFGTFCYLNCLFYLCLNSFPLNFFHLNTSKENVTGEALSRAMIFSYIIKSIHLYSSLFIHLLIYSSMCYYHHIFITAVVELSNILLFSFHSLFTLFFQSFFSCFFLFLLNYEYYKKETRKYSTFKSLYVLLFLPL